MIALMALASACSADHSLDGDRLEADIAEQLLPSYPDAVRSISCPDPADPSPGDSVLCVANLGGTVVDVNVALGGTEEELTSTATIDVRFVAVNEVAALLAATFGDEVGIATSVDCGDPVLVLGPEDPVVCIATDASGVARFFDVRVDQLGQVSLELR